MNVNKASLFWGILLIGGGALALAQQMGYLDQLPDNVWMWIFALVSLAAFLSYALSGWREWGWLFPAGVAGGLAIIIGLATAGYENAAIASPLFFGLLLPFAAAYLSDRSKNWWALIPGGVMLFLAMVTLLVDNVGGEWIGAMFLFLIALSFLIVYLNNRTRIWALLVAYILFVLGIAPAMASFGGNVVQYFGSIFLFAAALPFLVLYLNNHTQYWALIVAYVLFVLSLAPAMAFMGGSTPAYYGAVFLFAVALPFFIVYFRSPNSWWAIIPAGVLTTLAVITGAVIAGWIHNEQSGGYANALLMFGLAGTFAVLWLRHAREWAKVVTIVLVVLGAASVFFASYTEIFWPVAIILVGAYLLYNSMRPRAVH